MHRDRPPYKATATLTAAGERALAAECPPDMPQPEPGRKVKIGEWGKATGAKN